MRVSNFFGSSCLLAALCCSVAHTTTSLAADSPVPRGLGPDIPTTAGAFLSVQTAVEIGLTHHPFIRQSEETALMATATTEQAKARYYPWLDAYGIQTGGTIRPLSRFNIAGAQNKPTSYVESAGVLADQLIYDFGQTSHRVSAERYGKEAAFTDILSRRAAVIMHVKHAYIQCLSQLQLVKLTEEIVRERGVLRDQIVSLYKAQLKSKLDLDLVIVELKSAEAQLIQVRNDLRMAFATLNNAMGVEGVPEYTIEEVVEIPLNGKLDDLIQTALEARPELLSNAKRIHQAEERVNTAHALNYPTISAVGMSGVIHFSDAPLNQYGGAHVGQTNLWWGAAATISVPIFTGFLLENRVAEATQDKYKLEQRKNDTSNRVRLEVAQAFFTLQTVRVQIGVAENEVQAARSAWELASNRYRMGLASIVDVTNATTALLSAEVQLSDARYAVQTSSVALAYAVGKGYQQYQAY
jgi:outer membrane protein